MMSQTGSEEWFERGRQDLKELAGVRNKSSGLPGGQQAERRQAT